MPPSGELIIYQPAYCRGPHGQLAGMHIHGGSVPRPGRQPQQAFRGVQAGFLMSSWGRERRVGWLTPPAAQEPRGVVAGSRERAAGVIHRLAYELGDGVVHGGQDFTRVAPAADR